jgi:mannose-6-phosphate isomerase-like protein (cupin superfamily)
MLKMVALASAAVLGFAAISYAQNAPAPAAPGAAAPAAGAPAGRGAGRGPVQRVVKYAWAPKPIKPAGWTGVNKPVHRIADILASHKGQARWTQEIVRDGDNYSGKWIQMAAGDRVAPQFYADDRVMMIIYSGQLRISIEGQEPFVAGPGFLVTVPYRTTYSMDVVGEQPAVRFEVNGPNRLPFNPTILTGTDKPADPRDFRMTKISWAGNGDTYGNPNPNATANTRPYLDFQKEIVQGGGRAGAFVSENGNFMNVINQAGAPTPPDSNQGHWHTDYNEFWYIAQGQVDYKMEGMPVFTAGVGDVVYAAQGLYHRASGGGTGMSTRIAINPRPSGLHNYHEAAEARQ